VSSERSWVEEVGLSRAAARTTTARVERPDLGRRQGGEQGQAARRELRGQPDADVADQRGPPRGTLLDEVEDVVAVQHAKCALCRGLVDEPGQDRAGQAL
jgi:hypothetical protein